MAEPQSALSGAEYSGFVRVAEAAPQGMITLRGDLGALAMQQAVRAAVGAGMPGVRSLSQGKDGRAAAWMSPDEVLLLLRYSDVPAALAALQDALKGTHALAVDVSDARATFTLSGAKAREVLAKLCPVDLAPGVFAAGEVRRTRAAQVPVAFWISGKDEFTLICFRSVARYVFDILCLSAKPGGEVGLFSTP